MSAELVLHNPDQAFSLAERIARSNLLPTAYRNKPQDTAIALMMGAEIGLPPMTSLNRIVVVEGKPTLDAQGMVAVIRQAGHSISGEVSSQGAKVVGKRKDTGDEMTVSFTLQDAQRAGLANRNVWKSYPGPMCWARAVSQLARMLFADCLLGFSYVPEEADFDGKHNFTADGVPAEVEAPSPQPSGRAARVGTVRPAPEPAPVADPETGEIVPNDEPVDAVVLIDEDQQAFILGAFASIEDGNVRGGLKRRFATQFGKPDELPADRYDEASTWLLNEIEAVAPAPAYDPDDPEREF